MLVRINSTYSFAKAEAGGKGFNLYRLSNDGFPVPTWFVLGKSAFVEFLKANQLEAKLAEKLQSFESEKVSAFEASKAIEDLIVSAVLPQAVTQDIETAFESLCSEGAKSISVRSSAADEDGNAHSFAGQLSSFLYVDQLDDVKNYVKKCWASGFSERCLVYRKENNIDLQGIRVSVVLQAMLDPDKSGVLFTCDPLSEKLDSYLISAVYGVGEGLVSGALDADNFCLDARNGKLIKKEIAEKTEAFRRSGSGHCAAYALPEGQRSLPVLDESELKELFAISSKIADVYNYPQDVEWALCGSKLYVLQTRPVTTLKKNLVGYINLWDNSNIIESYGGLTSPLSFSFARRNYRNVYVQFCEVLNVPSHVIKEMDDYLGYMLGSLYGRVYYNLFNWYKLVGVLPGFKQNRAFMETMMGVSEKLDDEIADRIKPHPSWNTWVGKFRKLKTGLSFLYYHFKIQDIVDKFLKDFMRDYLSYRDRDYFKMRGDQIFQIYIDMEKNMIGRWKAPIINDFLCMVHFGMLKKLTNSWLSELDSTLQNDLLAGEGNLESAEPTKELIRMASEVEAEPELKKLILSTQAPVLYEALKQSRHQEFFTRVRNYIDRFGFRCMNEMKLEEIDLYQDPSYLFVCLKNYLRSGTTDLTAFEKREKQLRQEAEKKVELYLRGWKKRIFNWTLRHARKAIRNRENTRFARTRIYGVARTMFQAMGEDLAARQIIENPRDIFYLELEEIFGIYQGTLSTFNLQDYIRSRKNTYASYIDIETKPRVQTRGPVYWQNALRVDEEDEVELSSEVDPNADLFGLPCCPGVIEGVVKVVESPQDDLELNGEILVTSRTDPGWVPLYPSVSGLLVERGSLLSHSAIVAREMGLPAIVSIKGLAKKLKSGMRIRMDGKTGCVYILEAGKSTKAS